MKRLETKEGKGSRSRCEHLGDKRGGRFHSADIPRALMKDFKGVASAVLCLAEVASREEGKASTVRACADKTLPWTHNTHPQRHLGNELGSGSG